MTFDYLIVWNSVDIPAPKDRRILIFAPPLFVKTGRWHERAGFFVDDENNSIGHVTAWADLPCGPNWNEPHISPEVSPISEESS